MSLIKSTQKSLMLLALFAVILGGLTMSGSRTESSFKFAVPTVAAASASSTSSGSTIQTCKVTASVQTIEAGSDLTITWTTQGFSSIKLNGQTVSGPNGSKVFTNIQENTTYTLVAMTADGKSSCTSSVTVTCIPVPPPTCTLNPASKTINSGDTVTLNWTTTNAKSASLTSFGNVPVPNGSRTTAPLTTDTIFTLTVLGKNGDTVKCYSDITVTPPVFPAPTCTLTPTTKTITAGESVDLSWTTTNARTVTLTTFGSVPTSGTRNTGALNSNATYTLTVVAGDGRSVSCHSNIIVEPPKVCKLVLTKAVNKTTAKPGDELIYTITIKNTGTGDCTGNGVRIIDQHDAKLVFVSQSHSTNISDGYGTTPVYQASNRTLTWNGNTLNPGEVGTITWKAKVQADLTCGKTYEIPNAAKATALELDNYTTWAYSNTVKTEVFKSCPAAPVCDLEPATKTIKSGESVNLTWTSTNGASATLTTFGNVPLNGSRNTGALTSSKTYTLTILGLNGSQVSCHSVINVEDLPPAPTCDAFTATPSTITRGASSTLAWTTSNATRVVINNGVGEVSATGTFSVSPLSTIEYTLKAYGASGAEVSCLAKVNVDVPADPLPECTSFTATPNSLPFGGGSTVLAWQTKNGVSASISPTIGAVGLNSSTTVQVASTTTFVLTVVGKESKSVSCQTRVTVTPPTPLPFNCANNVNFSASPSRIDRGDNSVLTWSTTGVDSLSFDQGISATGLSGSVTVEPSNTTTYTLRAVKGSETISCPVVVEVSSGGGGGGGGSSSPTCDLTISDNKINRGEQVTLRWDSSRATNLELVDSKGKVLVTTHDKLSDDKKDYFDGSIKVSPTSDTTYTLTVERGSRDRVCKVSVDVEDSSVTQIRDQQPLVTGISLTQVPYTGFAAGPITTMFFYMLLLAWALYVAYVLVIKRDVIGGYKLAESHFVADELTPEQIRPDVFVASVKAPTKSPSVHLTPDNLPVASPVIGYAESKEAPKLVVGDNTSHQVTDEDITTLENYAHSKRALLSGDAIRHLVSKTESTEESITALNEIILEAKAKYPSEDNWVVINEKRMRELCVTCQAKPEPSSAAPFVPTVIPEGSGSLAEAIVTGNVVAAYEMIGHRPMFALADAASDMDSVYRARRGGKEVISDLLLETTKNLTDEQITKIIEALTGALDGTYTDEASAVKMAIMKAVKVVS